MKYSIVYVPVKDKETRLGVCRLYGDKALGSNRWFSEKGADNVEPLKDVFIFTKEEFEEQKQKWIQEGRVQSADEFNSNEIG